jgi:hypothetical protein
MGDVPSGAGFWSGFSSQLDRETMGLHHGMLGDVAKWAYRKLDSEANEREDSIKKTRLATIDARAEKARQDGDYDLMNRLVELYYHVERGDDTAGPERKPMKEMWEEVKTTFKENPGNAAGVIAGQFVKVMLNDPELLVTPIGYEVAAARTAAVMGTKLPSALAGATGRLAAANAHRSAKILAKTVTPIMRIKKPAGVAAGLTGAGAMGGGVVTVMDAMHQLAEFDEVDWNRAIEMGMVGALIAAPTIGLFHLGKKFMPASVRGDISNRLRNTEPDGEMLMHQGKDAGAMFVVAPKTRVGQALSDAADQLQYKAASKFRPFYEFAGFKSITAVDYAAQKAPSWRVLRNIIEPEEMPEMTLPWNDVWTSMRLASGKLIGDGLTRIKDKAMATLGRRLTADERGIVASGLRGITRVTDPVLSRVVEDLKKLRSEMWKYGVDGGVLGKKTGIPHIKNWLARFYNVKYMKTKEGQAEFEGLLMSKYKFSAEEANTTLSNIIDNNGFLEDHLTFEWNTGRNIVKPRKSMSTDHQRKLANIKDEDLQPFLNNDAFDILERSIEALVRRVEHARAYGTKGQLAQEMLIAGRKEALEAGITPAQVRAVEDRFIDIINAQGGNYMNIKNPTVSKLQHATLTYQYVRTLPFATLGSMTEPFVVAYNAGPRAFAAALKPTANAMVRNIARYFNKSVDKGEALKWAEVLGVGHDAATMERLASIVGERVGKVGNVFFKGILLEQFTRFNRVLAAVATGKMIEQYMKYIAKHGTKGSKAESYIIELSDLGIPALQVLEHSGGKVPTEMFNRAVVRAVDRAVMSPRVANRPMWMNNPKWALVSQLKGFQTTFGNTVMKRVIRNMMGRKGVTHVPYELIRSAAVGSLMMYTAFMADVLRHAIKDVLSGKEALKDYEFDMVRLMDRAGFFGAIQFSVDMMKSQKFGSGPFEVALGPTAGQAGGLMGDVGGAIMAEEGDPAREFTKWVLKAIPGIAALPEARKSLTNAITGER